MSAMDGIRDYFTVILPAESDYRKRTVWHVAPELMAKGWTSCTRGVFASEADADAWCAKHVPGCAYSVRFMRCVHEVRNASGGLEATFPLDRLEAAKTYAMSHVGWTCDDFTLRSELVKVRA